MNKKKLINQINIYRSVLILLVICVFATILSPSFLSVTNLFNVFKQITVAGIVGCGMTFVILTGGIDLSVGSILGLSGVLASGVLASTGNTAAAVAVSLVVGVACGAVNGFFVSVCGIPPFISTLGMMTLLRGVILVYTKGLRFRSSQMPINSLVKAVLQAFRYRSSSLLLYFCWHIISSLRLLTDAVYMQWAVTARRHVFLVSG